MNTPSPFTPSLDPVDDDVRERYERLAMQQTGVRLEWMPAGVESDHGWRSTGRAACAVCEEWPATVRCFDVDGGSWDICNRPGQVCFERLKSLVALEPAPAELVDRRGPE